MSVLLSNDYLRLGPFANMMTDPIGEKVILLTSVKGTRFILYADRRASPPDYCELSILDLWGLSRPVNNFLRAGQNLEGTLFAQTAFLDISHAE